MVGGPWVGIADLSFSMVVMMNSGSDDSIVKLSIFPQLSMLAVILLSGILCTSVLSVAMIRFRRLHRGPVAL